jgi:protein phosphatase
VSKSKIVLFGGATGDTGRYIITGDTYGLDLIASKWSKLEGKFKNISNEIYLN